MTQPDPALLAAAGAAALSSIAAMSTAIRQGRVNRRLVRLQTITIERREFRDSLLLLGATSRVVAERGAELSLGARSNVVPAEFRPSFEAFSASAEYLLQAWSSFAARITPSDFGELRESVSQVLEATESTRLGWMVLTSGGPGSTTDVLAAYADTAARWSAACQQMCAVGAQAARALPDQG